MQAWESNIYVGHIMIGERTQIPIRGMSQGVLQHPREACTVPAGFDPVADHQRLNATS